MQRKYTMHLAFGCFVAEKRNPPQKKGPKTSREHCAVDTSNMQNHGFSVFFFSVWLTIACQTTGFTKSTSSLFAILRTYKKTLCFLYQKKTFRQLTWKIFKRTHSQQQETCHDKPSDDSKWEKKWRTSEKKKTRYTPLLLECQNKKKKRKMMEGNP